MKNIFMMVCAALLIFGTGCSMNPPADSGGNTDHSTSASGTDETSNPDGTAGSAVNRSVEVLGSDETLIGHVISAGRGEVVIVNETGYIFVLNWDGTFLDGKRLYFSGLNGSGEIFVQGFPSFHEKAVFFCDANDSLYKLAKTKNGLAQAETTEVAYRSYSSAFDSSIADSPGTIPAGEAYSCIKADRKALGIPDVIAGPLKLVFR